MQRDRNRAASFQILRSEIEARAVQTLIVALLPVREPTEMVVSPGSASELPG